MHGECVRRVVPAAENHFPGAITGHTCRGGLRAARCVNFRGTVIANASITVGSSANLTGRALAGTGATGAVTMAGAGGNTIGGCSVAGTGVPTLSDWSMIALIGLLALAGV